MKFEFTFEKRNCITSGIAFAVMLGFCLYSGKTPLMAVIFGAVYFLLKGLSIELTPKLNYVWLALEVAVSSVFTELLIQHMLLLPEDRTRITSQKWTLNILCCAVVYLGLIFLTARPKIACMTAHIFLMSLGGINYFVWQFRQNEFTFGDLKAISTGLSVASEYHFSLDTRAAMAVILSIVYVAGIRRINLSFKRIYVLRALSLCAAVVLVTHIAIKAESIVTETWEQKGTYRNGYILNFVLGIRDSFVEKPADYSLDTIKELEDRYGTTAADADVAKETEDAPVIIAIMNESFADLGVIGDLRTNQEVTPFLDSMDTNITKGYALSSVFGAKTPNSEWEFLTGNTMAYLPSGSVAYQQYVSGNTYSLVSTLESYGYNCVSMHPYYATGWSRNKVYPLLGFTQSYFIDDFDQSNIVREYITDEELYNKIIAQYEAKDPDEKLFIMSITMQNHGGYTDEYPNFTENVRMTNGYYSDVNQYLSLVNTSDQALEKLINYFSNVDQKVEIVFFGDHQPADSVVRPVWKLNGKDDADLTDEEEALRYKVPFFIWANFNIETEKDLEISANYLAAKTLDAAGLPKSAYDNFLSQLRTEVPVISANHVTLSDGTFTTASKQKDLLYDYQTLQYYLLFD